MVQCLQTSCFTMVSLASSPSRFVKKVFFLKYDEELVKNNQMDLPQLILDFCIQALNVYGRQCRLCIINSKIKFLIAKQIVDRWETDGKQIVNRWHSESIRMAYR